MSADRKPVYIIQMNHFDPLWRRCWDRRVEYAGRGETVEFTLPEGFSQAAAVNLLERQAAPIPVVHGMIRINLAPFKLITLRLDR